MSADVALWDLPESWAWARFKDVAKVDADLVDPGSLPDAVHIAPNHIESGTGCLLSTGTVASDGVTSAKHRFWPGQIIYSKIRPYLAKAVLVDFPGVCSADCYPVSSAIDTPYLHRWLVSPMFTAEAADNQGRTVLPKINQEALAELPVPVAPAAEQRRIVARLDALQSRSRAAREALAEVPALLDQLRQSVLAAAFRGELTAEWRARGPVVQQHPHHADLPPGWRAASLEELGDVQLGQQRAPGHASAKVQLPYLRAANVTWSGLDLSDIKTMGFDNPDRYRLKVGDVLLSEASGSPMEVGKPAIWRGELDECYYQKTLIRVRPHWHLVSSDWLYLCFLWDALSGRFAAMAPGVGILHLTAARMLTWPVTLPPLPEQEAIVQLVYPALKQAEGLARVAEAANADLTTLDQSILARAFRGELVEQDPNDEPAEALLARLRAERASSGKPVTRRGRG